MKSALSGEKVPVYISRELYEKVKKFVETHGGFENVEEAVEFIVDEVLFGQTVEGISKEDEERVKERLKSLGYI